MNANCKSIHTVNNYYKSNKLSSFWNARQHHRHYPPYRLTGLQLYLPTLTLIFDVFLFWLAFKRSLDCFAC